MPLKTVVDTNVLLVSISRRSRYHWLYQALIEERYELLVSTSIVLEYEEIIGRMMGRKTTGDVMGVLLEGVNVHWVDPHYHWHLIKADPEDDKFVDCAIAGGADCIVTYDRHFDVLQEVEYPHVPVVTPEEFRELLESSS